MSLRPGAQLGPYEIVGFLGAGGMGEVHKARDLRLDRTVAIKILPQHIASAPEVRERFDREAKAVASLNHRHICTLHDVGRQDGIDFLVMEFLEGETLEQRLQRGALPLEQALQTAIELADALATAHRAGVVHRDLKPGNIMLTKAGAKLLDFGLAKLHPTAAIAGMSIAATVSGPLTSQGTILGTIHYMAPEQVEGKEADARSDIFAFGAIVHEMATGKRAFDGTSAASLIAAILERQPPAMSTVQPLVPPSVDHLVRQCLAKDPDERWQSASDVMRQLRWILESQQQTAPVTPNNILRDVRLAWSVTALFCVAVLAGAAYMWATDDVTTRTSVPGPVTRFSLGHQAGPTFEVATIAVSPRGDMIVFSRAIGSTVQLYRRPLHSLGNAPIPGTEGGSQPFFSPDGQWIGFSADGRLKKVPVNGGTPTTLCNAPGLIGATWGNDNTIIFAPLENGPLLRVPAAGGTPTLVAMPRKELGEFSYRWPHLLPGDRHLLFAAATTKSWNEARIILQSIETGERRVLIEGGANPVYVATGHILYARYGNLFAVPFDPERLEVTGDAILVAEDIRQSLNRGIAQYSVSSNGTLVFIPADVAADNRALLWIERSGRTTRISAPERAYLPPRLSPDGHRLVTSAQAPRGSDLWVYDFARDLWTPVTFERASFQGTWSPDGKRVAFNSDRAGPHNIFWRLADGTGIDQRLTTSDLVQAPLSWSPDGTELLYVEIHPETAHDVWALPLDGGQAAARPLLRTTAREFGAVVSPKGNVFAYASDESGRPEVYLDAFPHPSEKRKISTDGGTSPMWSRDGRELFYLAQVTPERWNLMVAQLAPSGVLVATPRVLIDDWKGGISWLQYRAEYDVGLDGRFITVAPFSGRREVVLVLQWFEELNRLMRGK